TKAEIIRTLYMPHRQAIQSALRTRGTVWHIASHSFTPVMDGEVRNCDIGLLYDPRSELETRLNKQWAEHLRARGWTVRRNYPYRGIADGLTTALRKSQRRGFYAGTELEVNQGLLETAAMSELRRDLALSLSEVLADDR